ncbi:MAG: large repetitive protein, partial [Pseudonocardiales bacterium]|nr:large repetitive protein [Pseudonocardiales bacterium]
MMRLKNLLILLSLLLVLAATGAYAAFSSAGTGSATASTGTLNAATTAVAKASNNSTANGPSPVTITWNAPSGGLAPTGYKVIRRNGTTQSDASCGVVTTTTCADTSVPDGTYTYVVRSLYNNSWTADSAASNSLQVVNDATPPAVTLTFPTNGNSYNIASYGGTCFPVGVCGSATDAAGVHGVQVSIKRNSDGSYWNGSSFVSSLLELFNSANLLSPDGTSTGWDYAFTRPADGGYTVNVRATDTAGNAPGSGSYSASATFTVDTAAPAVTLTAPANNSATTNTKPNFSGAAATAAGDQPPITVKIYSGSTTGGALVQTLNTTASTGAWSIAPATALADGTYTGQASQSDTAGNTGGSAANTFTIDTTAPSGSYTFPAAGASYNTTGWNSACATAGFCGTATDAGSGVATAQLQIKQISTNNNWDGSTFRTGNRMVNATIGGGAWSYAFNASSFPAAGQYQVSGTITDNVGIAFTLAARTFTVDTTAPTVTLTAPANATRTSSTKPTFAGAAGTA